MFTRTGLIALLLGLGAVAAAFWLGAGGFGSSDVSKPAMRQAALRDDANKPPAIGPPPIAKGLAAPSFDIVKVGPDGKAVIAGRGEPGATITVLDNGKVIGNAKADERGEWVILPDQPLGAGTRELALHADLPGQKTQVGEQLVVIKVPEQKDGGPAQSVAVALPAPGANSSGANASGNTNGTSSVNPRANAAVLQLPAGAQSARSGALEVVTLEYDNAGTVTVIGKAPAQALVQAYIDNALVGTAIADGQSAWRLGGTVKLADGAHQLRVDLLDPEGKVMARLELPLQRGSMAVAAGNDKGSTVTIVSGNNLWQIAQRNYGAGEHFTVIYQANRGQIRDPNLIYPGQIFVLPPAR